MLSAIRRERGDADMGDTGIGLLERCVVLRERCGGDERVVVLERRAAGLLVYYGTRGELTSEAFGLSLIHISEPTRPY